MGCILDHSSIIFRHWGPLQNSFDTFQYIAGTVAHLPAPVSNLSGVFRVHTPNVGQRFGPSPLRGPFLRRPAAGFRWPVSSAGFPCPRLRRDKHSNTVESYKDYKDIYKSYWLWRLQGSPSLRSLKAMNTWHRDENCSGIVEGAKLRGSPPNCRGYPPPSVPLLPVHHCRLM